MNLKNKSYSNKDLDMPEVIAECKINPSEEEERVITAIRNVINAKSIEVKDERVIAVGKGLEALRKIYESARSRQILGVLKRVIINNMTDKTTWFYINKQAAYVGVVSICDDPAESPLGPIRIRITSEKIEDIIKWLTS